MNHILKLISILIVVSLLFASVFIAKAENIEGNLNSDVSSIRSQSYISYIEDYRGKFVASETINIDVSNYLEADKNFETLKNHEGYKGDALLTPIEGTVTWKVNIPDSGLYSIYVEYYPYEGTHESILRSIHVNGEVPFYEALEIEFERNWIIDSNTDYDKYDNQIRPKQMERVGWSSKYIKDSSGNSNEPLKFYLPAGENNISFVSLRGPMVIRKIALKPEQEEELPNYQQYIEELEQQGYEPVKGAHIEEEAEEIIGKSDQSIALLSDRTSPRTSPYHHTKTRYNTIGGDSWQQSGQWIEWTIKVPEDGLYNIALRFKQSMKINDISWRTLYINGNIPFEEAKNIGFSYDSNWQLTNIGDGNLPYLFYLSEGENVLRLEVATGYFSELIPVLNDYVYRLNNMYRNIVMITGPSPDVYRDYQFDNLIPEVLEEMTILAQELNELQDQIFHITGDEYGQNTAVLKRMVLLLKQMVDDNDSIANRLRAFQNDISSLSSWVILQKEQPLQLDNIIVYGEGEKLPRAEGNIFERVKHHIFQFIGSFYTNYSSLEKNNGDGGDITVWVGSSPSVQAGTVQAGRDQSQIIERLTSEYFSPNKNIEVTVQLVSPNALLPAILAGTGPDVALQQAQNEPLNYAFRNAAHDLSQFPDFAEVTDRFFDSALVPFTFEGKTYAIPETQSFPMLFYRRDILDEIGVDLHQLNTWDGLLQNVLPKLQMSYLQFGMLTNYHNFSMLLMQEEGSIYNINGTESEVNSIEGIRAFRRFTEIYTDYRQPMQFDFANRFRIGEMPLAIMDFTAYNQLSVFAPEIRGLWSMHPVPGIINENGEINRSVASSVTGCLMLSNTDNGLNSWEFMKWWTSSDIQYEYGMELERIMGPAARYPTANKTAIQKIPWPNDIMHSINTQWNYVNAIPEVPGGYFVPRYMDFAFRDVILHEKDARETINKYVREINREISNKRKEFGLSH